MERSESFDFTVALQDWTRRRKSSTQAKPKVGKRIAPKKQSALSEAIQKRVRSTH